MSDGNATKKTMRDGLETSVGSKRIVVARAKKIGPDVEAVAVDISKHFFSCSSAGDTVEGITDWWVARQRRDNAMPTVRRALEYLVRDGKVTKTKVGSRNFYRKAK